jgi:hypothetical protein
MSVRAVTWVLHESQSTGNDRLTLIVIADEADNDGRNAWPGTERISRLARVPKRTVLRCLQRLEAAGELLILRPEVAGRGRHNRYALTMGRPPDAVAGELGWPPPTLDPTVAASWAADAEECQTDTVPDSPQPGDKAGDAGPETARNGDTSDRFGCHQVAPDPKTQIDTRAPHRRGLDPRPDPVDRITRADRIRQAEGNRQVAANAGVAPTPPAAAAELLEGLRAALGPTATVAHLRLGEGGLVSTPNEDDDLA